MNAPHDWIRIALGPLPGLDWSVLRAEDHFLYRRIADSDRAVLAVGRREAVAAPLFNEDGCALGWFFGALRYEWKDVLFHRHGVDADHCAWWVPRFVVEWRSDAVSLHVPPGDEAMARAWVQRAFTGHEATAVPSAPLEWHKHCPRERYSASVRHLLAHIQRGDIYEVNYCTARSTVAGGFDPFAAFGTLLQRTAAPFAAFFRQGQQFALCASPERFLAFDGRRVTGQPMKGTRPRHTDARLDRKAAEELASDAKERSENIMALDVMRHDLSRIAASRSVRVEELCAVRSYPRVHQMTSTVSAVLRDGVTPMDVLRATFPMASMTGAPKLRAMQLIEEAEDGPRGLFSGSLGFFAPDGTGDFNVVIRTLLFDADAGRLSLTTGSAITALCDPEAEYEECEVKARSVIDALCDA